jgi:hypothetical protein
VAPISLSRTARLAGLRHGEDDTTRLCPSSHPMAVVALAPARPDSVEASHPGGLAAFASNRQEHRGSSHRRPGSRRPCRGGRGSSCRACRPVSCATCGSLLPFSIAKERPCHSRHIAPGGCHIRDVDGDQGDGLRGSRGRAQAVGGAPRLEPLPFECRPMPLVPLTLFSLDLGRRPARLRF